MKPQYLIFDYETRSKADLKKMGAYEYARHPSTDLLCVAWKLGTRDTLKSAPVRSWSPHFKSGSYGSFKKALLDPKIKLVAHNAFFEQVITRFVLTRLIHKKELSKIPISRWICTASLSRALALPGKLEHACLALSLPHQKDMEGHRLMLKMSQPRRRTLKSKAPWHESEDDLKRLIEYCEKDVEAETDLFLTLPPLIPTEREVWKLDQKINWRGFRCDRPLVKKILILIDQELYRFEKLTHRLTGGEIRSVNQRNALLEWIKKEGLTLPNLQKKTVLDFLASSPPENKVTTLLRVRADSSKTSTAKYEAFEQRSRSDSRIRDSLVYCAASTGRFGGAGLQPHNFPRGSIKNTLLAAELLTDSETDLETARRLYGNPMELFSSLLRCMIIPSPGFELFGGDFAGIEVRVLFWIAHHAEGLKAYQEGRDLYREIATKIYKKPLSKIESPEREVGKRAILGCGFGMGWEKFAGTCEQFGQKIEDTLAQTAVKTYRSTHWPICKLWYNLDQAAILAVRNPKKKYKINRVSWFMKGKYLFCELPSGRKLAYYRPVVKSRITPWGEKKPVLHHYDIHPVSKKWVFTGTYGGKLTENVVQAIARDIMVESMLRVEAARYPVLLTVHDEILAEKEKGKGSVSEFEILMSTLPAWAKGLPLKTECYTSMRYRK